MPNAIFITLEGGEGSGKSTQAKRIADFLKQKGFDPVLTREPGGTEAGESLRALLVKGQGDLWQPQSELLLMLAARIEHIHKIIRPALMAGKPVICDRFIDSTYAYQGFAGNIDLSHIKQIQELVGAYLQPDVTFLLDIEVETGLARAQARGGEARFEQKGISYHNKIRDGFLTLQKQHPERIKYIHAAQPIENVWYQIHEILDMMINKV